jgi:hypothetical protein
MALAFLLGVAVEAWLLLGDAARDPAFLLKLALAVPAAGAVGTLRDGKNKGIGVAITTAICLVGYALFRKPEYHVTERGAVCRTLTFWFAFAPFVRPSGGAGQLTLLAAIMTALVAAPLLQPTWWRWLRLPIFFWNGLASWITAFLCNKGLFLAALGISTVPMPFPLAQAAVGGIGFMCAAADGFAVFGMTYGSNHATQKEKAELKRRLNEVTHEYGPGAKSVLGIAALQAAVLGANAYARMVPESILLNLSLAAMPLLLRELAASSLPRAAARTRALTR